MLSDTAMIHYTRLLNELANLPRPKLQELDKFIQALLGRPEVGSPLGVKAQGEAVEVKQVGSVTIRSEYRKCGKACKCNGGKGHGPYRYAYWWAGGRTRSRYLGKAVTIDITCGCGAQRNSRQVHAVVRRRHRVSSRFEILLTGLSKKHPLMALIREGRHLSFCQPPFDWRPAIQMSR